MNDITASGSRHSINRFTVYLLILFLIIVIGTIIVLAAVPPVSRDALTHHLAVPKLYLQKGAIYEIPELEFSYYPMNLDMIYLVSLYFGNDILPKYLHFSFGLMTAFLIFYYLKRRVDISLALLGALFFLSIPVIVKLSISVYVDLGLIFFTMASLLALIKWLESAFKTRFLVLSGICCGLAMGTKYNALIVFFLITMFIPFCYAKIRHGELMKSRGDNRMEGAKPKAREKSLLLGGMGHALVFVAMALLLYSPWGYRNIVWTGNPIHPLYSNWVNPEEQVIKSNLNHFVQRKLLYGEKWWETALIPVRIFFQGKDDQPKYFDGRLNPFLLIFSLLAILGLGNDPPGIKREKRIFFWFSVLYLLFTFFSVDMRIRYISPIIGPLVILSMLGVRDTLEWINRRPGSKRLFTGLLVACIGVMLLINARYVASQFGVVEPFSYLSGQVSREAYILKRRPEYEVISLANRNLSPEAKIFGLFLGNRGYYSDREIIFGLKRFELMVKKADDARSIVESLRELGISHLLVGTRLFNQWAPRLFDDRERKMLNRLFKDQLELIVIKRGYAMYAVPNNSGANNVR